ncbi:MAG: TonB-dependent receptor [Saprospiraceae bacterium]|nr:TonB-dependent receptor [Saprospiraceae bacterium]
MTAFRYLLVGVVTVSYFQLYAQEVVASGRVIDQADRQPIEYASVAFYLTEDSSLIAGCVTDENGNFSLPGLVVEPMYYVVQFMGYQSLHSDVVASTTTIDVGILELSIHTAVLQEIQITGREVTSFHRLDKQVFDGKQYIQAQGGTAMDILRNLPAISVNANGEITVRGVSGFHLMIDGKPIQSDANVLLQQLPANAVEDVEIITSPSAQYDPDGKAGIIHIKTRRGSLQGLFISTNAQIGLPSIEDYDNQESALRYGADVLVNFIQDKWDLSVGLDYRRDDVSGQRIGYVNTYQNSVLTEFPSFGERSFDRESYTGRLTLEYSPTQKQTFSIALYAGKRLQFRTADILYDYQRRAQISPNQFLGPQAYWNAYKKNGRVSTTGIGQDSLQYFNTNLRVRKGDFLLGQLGYDVMLANDYELSLSGLYERTILGGPTDNTNVGYPNVLDTLQFQFNDNDNPLDGVRLQVDLSKKTTIGKWESGYQFRYLNHPGDFIYLDRNLQTNEWIVNPTFTNGIRLRRSIHALYSQITGKNKKLSYTVGLRVEAFDRSVSLDTPKKTFKLNQVNPFPSINLLYSASESLSLKAAYSRRIERTTTFKMTPFPEREHSETLEQGDAELLPEFIDVVEMGVIKNWQDNEAYLTGYWRNTANVVNRVNTIYNDSILNRIYTNAGTATALGLELGITYYPAKWCRLALGANIFNYQIKGNLFDEAINTQSTIYSYNTNFLFTLSPTLKANFALNYLSNRITAQGEDSRFYNPSFSLIKSFRDDTWNIVLQWLNIDMGLLNSNEQRITTVQDNFFTTTNYIYEVDIVKLGVSYRFNSPAKNSRLLNSEFGDKEF